MSLISRHPPVRATPQKTFRALRTVRFLRVSSARRFLKHCCRKCDARRHEEAPRPNRTSRRQPPILPEPKRVNQVKQRSHHLDLHNLGPRSHNSNNRNVIALPLYLQPEEERKTIPRQWTPASSFSRDHGWAKPARGLEPVFRPRT